jgi:hypothetical protein
VKNDDKPGSIHAAQSDADSQPLHEGLGTGQGGALDARYIVGAQRAAAAG